MLIGYTRVSTHDQNLALQREALEQARCEKIYADSLSAVRAERPGLTQTLDALRAGDTLVIWKLDRLGRRSKISSIWAANSRVAASISRV